LSSINGGKDKTGLKVVEAGLDRYNGCPALMEERTKVRTWKFGNEERGMKRISVPGRFTLLLRNSGTAIAGLGLFACIKTTLKSRSRKKVLKFLA
jgi:hypothetical protein